jgi:hypothetical protein
MPKLASKQCGERFVASSTTYIFCQVVADGFISRNTNAGQKNNHKKTENLDDETNIIFRMKDPPTGRIEFQIAVSKP